mgnify:CR=1 FL=1|jgi:hypothetical protein
MKYLLVIGGLFLCGCTTWKWKHEPIIPKQKGGWVESYNYYVIDPNSDIPDAFFVNLSKAKQYKKDFAANHDYVIVKIDQKYNVYNVELDK